MDKTKKLWYLFLAYFWTLVPNIHLRTVVYQTLFKAFHTNLVQLHLWWVGFACCGFTSETCVKTLQSSKILRRRLWLGLWLGQSDLYHCFVMYHMELFFACDELLIFQARSWSKLLVYFLFCSWLLPCRH